MVDTDQKALDLTRFFFKVPEHRTTLAYLGLVSFIFGIIARLLSTRIASETLVETVLYGGADGVLLVAAPALLGALVATFLVSRKELKHGFKYFLFISLAAACVYSLTILAGIVAGIILPGKSILQLGSFLVIANALVLLVWLAACWIALAYKKKAFALCIFHPIANIAFIVLWTKFRVFESTLALATSPYVVLFKLLVASVILILSAAGLVYIINAPSKRNFGLSTLDVATMFFAQWVNGSHGLEDLLSETGEVITTPVNVTAFYNKSGKIKASFIVPQIHYGPIGNLGGSEFPGLLSQSISAATGGPAFIFKGAANHDFNPVRASSVSKIEEAALLALQAAKKTKTSSASLIQGQSGASNVNGFTAGATAFLTLSRAPFNCEDIHQSLGRALRNQAIATGFEDAVIVDRHNCKVDNYLFGPGSKEYIEYEKAISNLHVPKPLALQVGVAENYNFGLRDGVGAAGVKAVIIQTGSHKSCFLVVDANNCIPEFREKIVSELQKVQKVGQVGRGRFDFFDILTTDSHAVNSISGVHNPLGATVNWSNFIQEAKKVVEQAIGDVEPCSVGAASRDVELEVLGPQRSSELIITVNSIIAVLKILAPIIFVGAVLLAFGALVLVK